MAHSTATHSAVATHVADAHGHAHHPRLAHHFDSMEVQQNAAKLGMWLFLTTEVLLFSGLFVAYAVFRALHPDMFRSVSHLLDMKMGAINTGVLLFSSLTMALAVRAAQLGQKKWLSINLLLTLACGFGFLTIKYFEYHHKIEYGLTPGNWFNPNMADHHVSDFLLANSGQTLDNVRSFFGIYYCMTGLHGLHVIIGMGCIFWIWTRAMRNQFDPDYYYPVEIVGLYWHLVDLIWIYLFPLLYLVDRSVH